MATLFRLFPASVSAGSEPVPVQVYGGGGSGGPSSRSRGRSVVSAVLLRTVKLSQVSRRDWSSAKAKWAWWWGGLVILKPGEDPDEETKSTRLAKEGEGKGDGLRTRVIYPRYTLIAVITGALRERRTLFKNLEASVYITGFSSLIVCYKV